MPATSRGKLVTWKPDKAFGFIRPDDGGADVFVHLRDFGRISRAPQPGDRISYQRVADGNGRFRAADVQVDGLPRAAGETAAALPRPRIKGQRQRPAVNTDHGAKSGNLGVSIAVLFLAGVIGLALWSPLPVVTVPVYLLASLLAWLLYAFDKSAAMNRRWRTPEKTLLLVGLIGGWPGALIAQRQFRHKSRKLPFQAAFWLTVVTNCAALAWASTSEGAAAIRALVY